MRILLFTIILFLARVSLAQFDTIYFDENDKISFIDSSYYYTLISSKDSTKLSTYIRTEYYTSNNRIKSQQEIKDRIKSGIFLSFYENGLKKEEGQYSRNESRKKDEFYKIKNYWNNSGEQLITNGKGEYYEQINDSLFVVGQYLSGLKNGEWKFYYLKDSTFFDSEKFIMGKQKSPCLFTKITQTKAKPLDKTMEEYYINLFKLVHKQFGRKEKYLQLYFKERKTYISLIVHKNGDISNIKIEDGYSLGENVDEILVTCVKENYKWKPATKNDINIDQKVLLPIQFSF